MNARWIGLQRTYRFGERQATFLVVDPYCPTVQNISQWTFLRAYGLRSLLRVRAAVKVLITPTEPVKLVIVRSTYPKMSVEGYKIDLTELTYFYNELCGLEPKNYSLDWREAGF